MLRHSQLWGYFQDNVKTARVSALIYCREDVGGEINVLDRLPSLDRSFNSVRSVMGRVNEIRGFVGLEVYEREEERRRIILRGIEVRMDKTELVSKRGTTMSRRIGWDMEGTLNLSTIATVFATQTPSPTNANPLAH